MGAEKLIAMISRILLLIILLSEAYPTQGLLPACGPTKNLLPACYGNISGGRAQNVSLTSECCKNIRRFRFPGCLCVALKDDIGKKIDQRSAMATLSLAASCGRPLPKGFNCTVDNTFGKTIKGGESKMHLRRPIYHTEAVVIPGR